MNIAFSYVVRGVAEALLCAALCLMVFMPGAALASGDDAGMDAAVENGLGHLIEAVRDTTVAPDMAALAPVLDYALASSVPEPDMADKGDMPKKRKQGYGIFMRDEIDVPMKKLVRYCYDPNVPPSVLFPNSIRRGHWLEGSDLLTTNIRLWETLDTLDAPVVLRGAEYEEITPDEFSGSYYGYTLDRLLVMMPYKQHRVFISVSRQRDTSSVGKKGAIVGDDAAWDYVYTREEGATARGIGWMDTYMYDSSTVTVFFDAGPGSETTQYAVFKWLKAGWASLNVVKRSHILSGTKRFLDGFRRIMEDANLPSAEAIVEQMRHYEAAPESELVAEMQPYAQILEERSSDDSILSRKEFMNLIRDAGYAAHLTREELVHDLMKQFIKERLGIHSLLTMQQ